ncbi:MAG: DUF2892 domain-containing protein [Bacteroidia bacterium]|nr:DUF2892 domain-containing protein [Bacteroidia bacterium]MCZ2276944.1 DUF2892 domain-containing protein [Bacteroidia bacterium]
MQKNMGIFDRIIRLSAAVIIGVFYFIHAISGILAIWLGIVSIILFVTAFAGFCPFYWLFGVSSCNKDTRIRKPDH